MQADVGSDDSENAAEVHGACPAIFLAGEGNPEGGDSWIEKSGATDEDLLEWDQGGDREVCFKPSSVGTRSRGVEKLHRDDNQESPPVANVPHSWGCTSQGRFRISD